MHATFRFYKDKNEEWFIDLPGWTGSKADLEMVAGADTMLDKVSGYTNECLLKLSDEYFDGAETLVLEYERPIIQGGGGDYILQTYQSEPINHKMWLCEVTREIFDIIPAYIYFMKQ